MYEDDRVYVYASAGAAGWPYFLLEGHQRAALDEARRWLQRLLASCGARGVGATLEYVAVDDDGQEISEQYSVSLPAVSAG